MQTMRRSLYLKRLRQKKEFGPNASIQETRPLATTNGHGRKPAPYDAGVMAALCAGHVELEARFVRFMTAPAGLPSA